MTRTIAYSASGNTASDDDGAGAVLTHSYDSTDRLVEVRQGAAVLGAYAHNAAGQRVAKAAGGAVTHYIYDLGGNLIAEHDGATGIRQIEYGWLEGMLLGFFQSGFGLYAVTDHIGRPVMSVLWWDGSIQWEASYRPFGELHSQTGIAPLNLRFPGQYADAETGLHYDYFRDYDASLGRYIQSDPIGLQGGWNTYAYVGGNPVMRVDPEGLLCIPYGPAGNRQWDCDGIFDFLQKDYPPIPPDCCDEAQLVSCRSLAGVTVATSCAACAGSEGIFLPQCALCAASVVDFIFVCRAENCTICEGPDQLSCRSTGSGGFG